MEKNFAPLYIPLPGKDHVIDKLCSLVRNKNCLEVISAIDEDREEEAISWHLRQLFLERAKEILLPPMRRIKYNEITPRALELFDDYRGTFDDSIRNKDGDNSHNLEIVQGLIMNLVEAHKFRRIVGRTITDGWFTAGCATRTRSYEVQIVRILGYSCYLHLPTQDEMLQSTAFLAKLSTIQGIQIAYGKNFNGTNALLKDDASQRIHHATEKTYIELQNMHNGLFNR